MKKLLLIEDDAPTRKLTAMVLRFEGFEVLEANDGREGISAALSAIPDLVICDIMMPDVDGFGVLRALRADPRTALTPFIFVTAMVAQGDLRHGMEEGADDYITKPYNPDALLGSVRRRLEKRARQIEESGRRVEEVSLAVAASVPQEILTTLDHITTVTNLLAIKYSAQDPQVAAMHEIVTRESLHLRRIMRRLGLYAQLPHLYAHRFDLTHRGLASTSSAVLEPIAREVCRRWNRSLDLAVTSEPAPVPLGEDYLALLVEELVDNACKFSAPGTAIEVRGHGEPEFWSLAVCNRGSGLSASQFAQIGAFKQFWNGDQKPRGLGLGLALAQGVARLHGCEFTIQSEAETVTATVLVPLEN